MYLILLLNFCSQYLYGLIYTDIDKKGENWKKLLQINDKLHSKRTEMNFGI